MISASNLLVTGGIFNQNTARSSRGFDLLSRSVAPQALHDSGQVSDPARCHPNTRAAILADLEEWAHGLTYNYRMKWVSGSAGVGKTAIMRTTAETLEQKKLLLASFFFWRTGERCNTAEFLIPTLAYQIAISIPETRPYIAHAVEERPHIFTQKLEVQSRALIVDPILAVYRNNVLSSNYARTFVVDGLDECQFPQKQSQDVEKQCEILRTFYWIIEQLPAHFTLIIASRPEYHIQKIFDTSFSPLTSPLVLNDSCNAAADITRFYIDKFREIQDHHPLGSFLPSPDWPAPKIIETLVANASGQFIYASTVIKFVGAWKKDPSSQLDAILDARARGKLLPFQPLDLLYSTILSTVDKEDLPVTLRVLGVVWITRNYGEPPIAFWDYFLGLRQGEARRLMLGLESLLFLREKTCRFFHASLGDFLFDFSRSGLCFIDQTMVYEDLAKQGVFYLCKNHIIDVNMTRFIPDYFEILVQEANPTTELQNIIGRAEIWILPRDLKFTYPMFLRAIKGSRLPGKERLYNLQFDLYCSHLKCILPLYFDNEALAFLILIRVNKLLNFVFTVEGTHSLEKFVDEVYPLSAELKRIDKEQGFYLYGEGLEKRQGIFTSERFHFFTNAVEEVIVTMAEASHWYGKAALQLVKYLSDHSRYPIESGHPLKPTLPLIPLLLREWFERASTELGPIDTLQKFPFFGDELSMVKDTIDDYIKQQRSLRESETTVKRLRSQEKIRTILSSEGVWAAWVTSKASKFDSIADSMQDIQDIDE